MSSKDAFVAVIQENQGLIYKVSRIYTNNREDQRDLYQEIVYQLYKSFASFRNDAKMSTWMYRIALNTAIAHLNKEKRQGNRVSIDDLILNEAEIFDTLKEEQVAALYTMIGQLNTVEKGIIILYLEGKNYEEIASITGFTVTNIGTRLGRIKQKIKSLIN